MKREDIGKAFTSMCHVLAAETHAAESEDELSKKQDSVRLKYAGFELKLCFLKASASNTPPCTLFCLFVPLCGKNRYLHLGEVTDTFDCTVFPYIENIDRLKKCFDSLSGIIKCNLGHLHALASDPEKIKSMLGIQEQELRQTFHLKDKHFPSEEDARNNYLIYIEGLYTFTYYLPALTVDDAYISYLKGEFDAAEKRYQRKKSRINAEERLAAALTEMDSEYRPMPDGCFAAKDYAKVRRGSRTLAFAMTLGVLTLLLSIIIYAVYLINSIGTVYTYKTPWYNAVLPAMFPALFAAYLYNGGIIKLIRRDWGRRLSDFNEISFGPILRVAINTMLTFSLAMSLMTIVWATSDTVRFYDDRLTVPAVEYPTPWTEVDEYMYDDISEVYIIGERVGNYGHTVSRASYVIVFKNGYMLDLDRYLPYVVQKKRIGMLDEKYGITPKYVRNAEAIAPSAPNPE